VPSTDWSGMTQRVKNLFASNWRSLHEDYSRLENGRYPGVYLLAYTTEELEGKKVEEKDVFYVGMSHAGVKPRLRQFIDGLEKRRGHSGAMRFFTEYTGGRGYSKLSSKKTFFVTSISIRCSSGKKKRNAEDLRKMGQVAALEYYVLAHIREKLGREPELNKK